MVNGAPGTLPGRTCDWHTNSRPARQPRSWRRRII